MKAREIAEQKKAEKKLIEWLKQKPHGNSRSFYDYWKAQFNEYDKKK